jgi:hypothetical protein
MHLKLRNFGEELAWFAEGFPIPAEKEINQEPNAGRKVERKQPRQSLLRAPVLCDQKDSRCQHIETKQSEENRSHDTYLCEVAARGRPEFIKSRTSELQAKETPVLIFLRSIRPFRAPAILPVSHRNAGRLLAAVRGRSGGENACWLPSIAPKSQRLAVESMSAFISAVMLP